jgi:hypothetical protein
MATIGTLAASFRPVYLEAFPKEHIERVTIDAKADGSFHMNVFPKNITSQKISAGRDS